MSVRSEATALRGANAEVEIAASARDGLNVRHRWSALYNRNMMKPSCWLAARISMTTNLATMTRRLIALHWFQGSRRRAELLKVRCVRRVRVAAVGAADVVLVGEATRRLKVGAIAS